MPRENRLLLVLLQLKSLGIFLTLLHSPDCSFCTALAASWWMSGSRTEFACSELGRVGPLWLGFVNLRYMAFWQISSLSFQPSNVRKIIRIKKKIKFRKKSFLIIHFLKGKKKFCCLFLVKYMYVKYTSKGGMTILSKVFISWWFSQ